ncbi:hypothetical protein BU16DRAFT_541371 [Lophium mytilinum]|uniref:Uncharacterized protein n=1 Tax=Lophium mytilinum TaxID=390894 RepID=A0A6A6QJV6_9PEZI|nr:hypothetical protein BU16DRAFT_541371 [Lophium mytilinum]
MSPHFSVGAFVRTSAERQFMELEVGEEADSCFPAETSVRTSEERQFMEFEIDEEAPTFSPAENSMLTSEQGQIKELDVGEGASSFPRAETSILTSKERQLMELEIADEAIRHFPEHGDEIKARYQCLLQMMAKNGYPKPVEQQEIANAFYFCLMQLKHKLDNQGKEEYTDDDDAIYSSEEDYSYWADDESGSDTLVDGSESDETDPETLFGDSDSDGMKKRRDGQRPTPRHRPPWGYYPRYPQKRDGQQQTQAVQPRPLTPSEEALHLLSVHVDILVVAWIATQAHQASFSNTGRKCFAEVETDIDAITNATSAVVTWRKPTNTSTPYQTIANAVAVRLHQGEV